MRYTNDDKYVAAAFQISEEDKTSISDLPLFLGQPMSFEEVIRKRASASGDDKNYIVWKCGRTSHLTYGIASEIKSDYRWDDGVTESEEWAIKDPKGGFFSKGGDSGSLVYDSDGRVSGLLWGGRYDAFMTFATPIEAVMSDIKEVLQAKKVTLVFEGANL